MPARTSSLIRRSNNGRAWCLMLGITFPLLRVFPKTSRQRVSRSVSRATDAKYVLHSTPEAASSRKCCCCSFGAPSSLRRPSTASHRGTAWQRASTSVLGAVPTDGPALAPSAPTASARSLNCPLQKSRLRSTLRAYARTSCTWQRMTYWRSMAGFAPMRFPMALMFAGELVIRAFKTSPQRCKKGGERSVGLDFKHMENVNSAATWEATTATRFHAPSSAAVEAVSTRPSSSVSWRCLRTRACSNTPCSRSRTKLKYHSFSTCRSCIKRRLRSTTQR
mmetsp:Transcript_11479/g.48167  ORF Transcript_11479/g.48167 Transcript_11479/m.48167 type:complete len:278 (+) Transcript_11479:6006-6839(+)